MTPITSVDHTDTGKRTKKLTPTGPGGVGWLSRALMLSLSCLVAHCGGGSNTSNSSDGTGGASTSTGGATSSGGSASGGTNATGGAHTSGGGGASAVDGAGGSGGTPGSTSSGGTAPTGGAGGSKTSGAGGAAPTGGASGSGGAAAGGTTTRGTGGKSSNGGATNAGGATGTGGKSSSGGATGAGGATGVTFTLTAPGWTNMEGCGKNTKTSCAPLPTEITRSGAGTSPELLWTGAPEGTKSFVVLLQDLNNGTAHWILWNIPPTVTLLAANVDQTTATPATPAGSQQCGKGTDPATSDGYYGPGAPCNVYEFVVYALSISPFSPTNATDEKAVRTQLEALGSSILGTASLRGRTNQSCS